MGQSPCCWTPTRFSDQTVTGVPRMNRLLVVAGLGEGALTLLAVAWLWFRGRPLEIGTVGAGLGLGVGGAGILVLVNYALLRLAPPLSPVRSIRRLYRDRLQPLFATASPLDIVGISVAAGIGEELLFRGALQSEIGVVGAGVLFGVAHVGGRETVVFGGWVAMMGLGLGALERVSGGVLAPIVAHAVYDVAAISYIRFGRPSVGPGSWLREG